MQNSEPISCSPWIASGSPARVLVIRLHAIGDVALTLPAVLSFCKHYPTTQVDFLTTDICAPMLDAISLHGSVLTVPNRMSRQRRLVTGIRVGWMSRRAHYDIVIDLQRNWMTRLVRQMASPQAWSEFDRFGPREASLRVLDCFHAAGFKHVTTNVRLPIKGDALVRAKSKLCAAGWNAGTRLVVLNPAGLWKTRQWPLENYVEVARRLINEGDTQFLLIGTERIHERARYIAEQLGTHAVSLVEKTQLGEALAILHHCSGVISEDSGLMHMAWAAGIPTIAIFGSTNHHWSAPTGEHAVCFHSGDLECGDCMQPECKYDDLRCLTRVTPEMVAKSLRKLQSKND